MMPPPYANPHWAMFAKIPYLAQGPEGIPPSQWAASCCLSGIPNASALPTQQLTRNQVRKICTDPAVDVLFGYACVMAWGGQGARYARQAWQKASLIQCKLATLRSRNLSRMDAYDLFSGNNAVTGLGPSFVTKLLYFFRPVPDAYIMDQWTGKSVNLLAGMTVVRVYDNSPTNDNRSGNYQVFCEEIDAMAQLLGCRGDECEERLYSKGNPHPRPWRVYVRNHYPYDASKLRATYTHIPANHF